MRGTVTSALLAALCLGAPSAAGAADFEALGEALGQRVYLSIYSHVYQRSARGKTPLAATVSIRNTDADQAIRVTSGAYYDSAGKLVRDYVETPLEIGPLATADFVVPQRDDTGGVGANFIIEWTAESPAQAPIVEAVMIGVLGNQSFSFTTQGRVLFEMRP